MPRGWTTRLPASRCVPSNGPSLNGYFLDPSACADPSGGGAAGEAEACAAVAGDAREGDDACAATFFPGGARAAEKGALSPLS